MPGPALAHNASEYSLEDAISYVGLTLTENSVLTATSTLLVYELVTTFSSEVERVWSLKWRLPKILFFLNRYISRALLVLSHIAGGYPGTSPSFCQVYAYWQALPARIAVLTAQALVVIRVWAIYNNSRVMLCVLSALYTLEVAAVLTFVSLATSITSGSSQPAPLSCGLDALSPRLGDYASGTWIAPVCFEFIIIIIAMLKVFPPLPHYFLGIKRPPRNPTMNLLARDSLIYFAFIFTFTLANAIIYQLDFTAHYRSILIGPTSAISCIAVSRMIINIRSLPAADPMSASDLNFADNSAFDGSATRLQRSGTTRSGRGTEQDTFEMVIK